MAAAALLAATPAGTWINAPALPVARSEVGVAVANERIYVIGGYASGNVDQALVQTFAPRARCDQTQVHGEWRDVAPLPLGLNHVGAVGYGGKVYVFGGFAAQNSSPVANAEVYDPSTDRWTPIAPLPHPLGSVSVAVLGNEIHLVGGRDVHSVATHLAYEPARNRYALRGSLPVGRDHMGLVAADGKLYAIGGRIDTPAHNTSYVDIYNPATNAWTSGAAMPTARSGMAVALDGRKIFAIGGEQAGMAHAFTANEAYDPSSNSWTEYQPLPEGRHGTGAVVVGARLFVPGGAPVPGGSRQSSTLFEFVLPDSLCEF